MMSDTQDALVFYVNGKRVEEPNPDPQMTLLYYLRNTLMYPGTKLGCGEGGCGACTVMVSQYNHNSKTIRHYSVNACLAPLCSMHGLSVTTVEAIGSTRSKLHPVQERISSSFGSQCGFCTPGIVMSMYTLLRNNPTPSRAQMESAFEGNLCRCTGYRPILDGFSTFTKEFQCGMGEQCCKNNKNKGKSQEVSGKLFDYTKFSPYDPTQEPIFPSELQINRDYDKQSLKFSSDRVTWYRPVSLEELVSLKSQHPDARLVVGNTEIGVEVKFKNMLYPVLIAATHIPELDHTTHHDDGIEFGASTSLASLEHTLKEAINKFPEYQTRVFDAIVEMLRWFAGHQIRNVAAIAGNIMTASPISDLNPLFMAAGCRLKVISKEGGERFVKMDHKFFLGYRRTVLKAEEVLVSIHIPFSKQNEYFMGYKQAQRREDDIAIVNAGMQVILDNDNRIEDLALSFGGMAPVTVMATKTMEKLRGRSWDASMVEEACQLLADDLPMPPGVPGGMETYRRTLTTSFFYKFYLTVLGRLHQVGKAECVPDTEVSATARYSRPASSGIQIKEEPGHDQSTHDGVGRSKSHRTSRQQATGEAQYTDDIPRIKNELYLALVTSTKAHARILKVDATPALSLPGVTAFYSRKDIPGRPMVGTHLDEPVFADDVVTCEGMVIGAVVAENQMQAQRAAKAVIIEYEELKPIITIEEAIEANSFHGDNLVISQGDVEAGFLEADHVVEGTLRIGGQEHFYLETQSALVIPRGEDDELEIFCSTQAPFFSQTQVSLALGIPLNRINVRTKRLGRASVYRFCTSFALVQMGRNIGRPVGASVGGGFGGKESQTIFPMVPAALAAHKLNRPVRCMLDRDEDMIITGTRHPMLCQYKVGYNKDGKLVSVFMKVFSNAGNAKDLSHAVLERALFHADNTYNVPNMKVIGRLCKTNLTSNTAFRGFGGPQGMFFMESVISNIALSLNMKSEDVREVNMYKKGDKAYFQQEIEDHNLRRCWDEVIASVDLLQRRKDIEEFNRQNRWKKRGLCVMPTKFGIAFTLFFLNQAGALVHVYRDGSVFVSHGGIEMGQGLHTKMVQVASRALGIPMEKIHIMETNTVSVPNTSATAASSGSDLNGMAILDACEILMKRLEPIRARKPDATWEELIDAAYMEMISLSTTGFYKLPGCWFDWEKGCGHPFNYFTFGAAVSEVEIDCLTGDHTVLKTDIVMDIGQSLNPGIDIGQIEGGFMQGYGLFTLEFQRYSPKGVLYSRGPGAYKIPGFGDIPIDFNVSLLKGSHNKKAVYSSKAIGEPPLFLAAAVFFAIKEAISAARADSGLTGPFTLDSPATSWQIRMACEDKFTKQFPEADPSTYTPWFVYP